MLPLELFLRDPQVLTHLVCEDAVAIYAAVQHAQPQEAGEEDEPVLY